jgi:zinc D-Ala-D-Ala carboxypeptidase
MTSGTRALAPNSHRSPALQRSAPPRPLQAVDGDIPLARRVVVPLRRRRLGRLALGLAVLSLVLGAALLVVVPGLVGQRAAPWSATGPVQRPAADGRLLGHFPYREVPAADRVSVAPGLELHRDAAEALLAMQDAARVDGIDVVLLSGFRSLALQQQLFFEVKSERNQSALERARVSAPPGYSEHSTGYAVDLGDGAAPQTNLSQAFDQTAAFLWLKANAARFHYVLSFPPGNAQGVNYEPWHWRFEGSAQALRVFEPAQRLNR